MAIEDVRADALTDDAAARETYARMQVVSVVCAPLVRGGKLVAVLVMSGSEPRRWNREESDLLEQVAERTLFAVESARAAQALREQRDVMQLAMSTAQMGAWSRDLVLDTVNWSVSNGGRMEALDDIARDLEQATRARQAEGFQ